MVLCTGQEGVEVRVKIKVSVCSYINKKFGLMQFLYDSDWYIITQPNLSCTKSSKNLMLADFTWCIKGNFLKVHFAMYILRVTQAIFDISLLSDKCAACSINGRRVVQSVLCVVWSVQMQFLVHLHSQV